MQTGRKLLNADKLKVPCGQPVVFKERCKGCRLCVEYCPKQVLEMSKDFNEKGYHYPQLKQGQEKDCINCGYCQEVCPDFAIYVEEVAQAKN
jgi:2-oxoglutarate ferredoxin oxidoreductase subunit delta